MAIFCIGMVEKNRMGQCELKSEPDLNRRSYEKIILALPQCADWIIRQFTFVEDKPIKTCKRSNGKEKNC